MEAVCDFGSEEEENCSSALTKTRGEPLIGANEPQEHRACIVACCEFIEWS